jgi:hypothetical protein
MLIILLFGIVYFMPWLIGLNRGVNSLIALLLVNLFLGWTVIGWIVCMIWAVAGQTRSQDEYYRRMMSEQKARARRSNTGIFRKESLAITGPRGTVPVSESPRG